MEPHFHVYVGRVSKKRRPGGKRTKPLQIPSVFMLVEIGFHTRADANFYRRTKHRKDAAIVRQCQVEDCGVPLKTRYADQVREDAT